MVKPQILALLGAGLVLVGCAAAPPPTPCQRACNRVYDSCMDAGGAFNNPQAMAGLEAQCGAAQQSCVAACQR